MRMPDQPNLLVLSNKSYADDFRKYMVRAARASGSNAIHVRCHGAIQVTRDDRIEREFAPDTRPHDFYPYVSALLGPLPTIVMTGYNGYPLPFVLRAPSHLENAVFLYDVFDDFSYGATGLERLRRIGWDVRWRRACHGTILVGEGLTRFYPRGRVIGNASHCTPVVRKEAAGCVYIGSIDQRVDFAWLDRLMRTGTSLDIYGRVHESKPSAAPGLERFLSLNPRARFHGAYDNDDLYKILAHYRVGVVPYKTRSRMTDNVHPDKIYHYLNSGLSVLSSGIPHALRLSRFVTIVNPADDMEAGLRRAEAFRPAWPHRQNSWDVRWNELKAYARELLTEPS